MVKNIIKRLFCRHTDKICISNIYGDFINIMSSPKKITRSIWKCNSCGKYLYESKLDPTCKRINGKKEEEFLNVKKS